MFTSHGTDYAAVHNLNTKHLFGVASSRVANVHICTKDEVASVNRYGKGAISYHRRQQSRQDNTFLKGNIKPSSLYIDSLGASDSAHRIKQFAVEHSRSVEFGPLKLIHDVH